MKKLIPILALLLLSGCASTLIKDSSLKKRTFSLNVLNVISVETSTEDLIVGEVALTKEN